MYISPAGEWKSSRAAQWEWEPGRCGEHRKLRQRQSFGGDSEIFVQTTGYTPHTQPERDARAPWLESSLATTRSPAREV
jgi:hypothetical protein